MATSAEEIKRQHEEACHILDHDIMPCLEPVDHGEIPLTQKKHPTFEGQSEVDHSVNGNENLLTSSENDNNQNLNVITISSRGKVCVKELASLVAFGYNDPRCNESDNDETVLRETSTNSNNPKSPKGPKLKTNFDVNNLWDDSNAFQNNVSVTRPSHDAWGIKKIVLIFCDDFLRTVYELPWWHHRTDLRHSIDPILELLNVPNHRIVRLLLAALPPGVTIPIHHDTGAWVSMTHRVHVPIVVSEPHRILFRCGLCPQTLNRVDCTPGHVFEMNNQAKHAVSNCSSDHRVHLILDYVDEDFHVNRRVQLQPGERLIQTRRSIDCLSDRGSRPTPTFLILGAQKAGTTSLYELIVQHPLAIRAKRRETHCLDWRWNEKAKTLKARRDHCLKFFHTRELEFHPSCLTGDSTPSYLLDSKRVIPRLKLVFPQPLRFFVMIRDPVARALSHYYMVTAEDGTPEQKQARGTEWQSLSFEDVIHKDLQHMKDTGLIPYFDLEKGEVDLNVWNSFSGSTAERQAWDRLLSDIPLNTGSHSLLARGLYELQLRPWFQFFPRERFLILQLEDFRKVGLGRIMNQVWDHLGLPQYTVVDESAKNSRSYPPMSAETKLYLERFYAPHNRKLKEVIEVEGWSYST